MAQISSGVVLTYKVRMTEYTNNNAGAKISVKCTDDRALWLFLALMHYLPVAIANGNAHVNALADTLGDHAEILELAQGAL